MTEWDWTTTKPYPHFNCQWNELIRPSRVGATVLCPPPFAIRARTGLALAVQHRMWFINIISSRQQPAHQFHEPLPSSQHTPATITFYTAYRMKKITFSDCGLHPFVARCNLQTPATTCLPLHCAPLTCEQQVVAGQQLHASHPCFVAVQVVDLVPPAPAAQAAHLAAVALLPPKGGAVGGWHQRRRLPPRRIEPLGYQKPHTCVRTLEFSLLTAQGGDAQKLVARTRLS